MITMLKEEGKLDYDQPVQKYLPTFPYTNINVRHLLNHTSGLPDYMDLMMNTWDKAKIANNDLRYPVEKSRGNNLKYSEL